MSTVWTILFALAAEAGGHGLPPGHDHARPTIVAMIRDHQSSPSRSLTVARKARHRACWGFASWTGPEECETEEVDESWMVHLDAIAAVPALWLCLAWSRSRSGPSVVEGIELAAPSHFPLRC